MKVLLTILSIFLSLAVFSQKVDSIYFNLYTDSLKKGVYNYINVDGKLSNGRFYPLMEGEVTFSSTAGRWDGNSLILPKDTAVDSVTITCVLKEKPEIKKTVTIYVKKIETEPPLKTEQELLDEWRRKGNRRKN